MAGYPTDTSVAPAVAPAARRNVDVPCGYSGNLTASQKAALAALAEELQGFVKAGD